MAKEPAQRHATRYVPCICNPVFHPQPVALPVRRGPKAYFIRCECGLRAYMPPSWTAEMGMTLKTAREAGLVVTTVNIN